MSTPDEFTGRFIWQDLTTPDPAGAAKFYGSVVGWGTRAYEGGPVQYWQWTRGQRQSGGLMELTDEAKADGAGAGWLGYVATPDVDRDAARAVELGGRVVVEPHTLPSVGRMAVIADPQGAVLTLMAPEMPEDAPAPDDDGSPIGTFTWRDLLTTDPDAAFEFYARLLGWEESRRIHMGEMGWYRIFASGGVELGGIFRRPDDDAGAPAWVYYIGVADLDAALERVWEGGGAIVHGPADVPGGRIAHCRDPQRLPFALHEESTAEVEPTSSERNHAHVHSG